MHCVRLPPQRVLVLLLLFAPAVSLADPATAVRVRTRDAGLAVEILSPRPLEPRGPRPPWPARRRGGVQIMPPLAQILDAQELQQLGMTRQDLRQLGLHPRELRALGVRPRGQGLIDQRLWPPEPPSPRTVQPRQLGEALRQLCPVLVPAPRLQRYAEWIVAHAVRFGVDPLLIAALIYQQSGCQARKQNTWGVGLAMINPPMHGSRFRGGRYHYWVLERGAWQRRQLIADAFPFNRNSLLHAEANIYFAAALLRVFGEQCPALDRGFGSIPHRHPVSHFVWGDRVRGAGPEDRILCARRRLIAYYHGGARQALGRFEDLPLHCPLDGCPRKITSGLGDDRDGGARQHTGVDFDSTPGEPVRAIADGTVVLAGVDWGLNQIRPLDPRLTRLVPAHRMGPRGLLVTLEHARGLTSSYMHLSAYVVRNGQQVKGGDLLGFVGRTGMKESDAHLHLGLQLQGAWIDPIPLLGPHVFAPEASYVGRNYLAVQRERRRRRLLRQQALRRTRQRLRSSPPSAWSDDTNGSSPRSVGPARTRGR